MEKLPQISFEIVVKTVIKKYNETHSIYNLSTRATKLSVE